MEFEVIKTTSVWTPDEIEASERNYATVEDDTVETETFDEEELMRELRCVDTLIKTWDECAGGLIAEVSDSHPYTGELTVVRYQLKPTTDTQVQQRWQQILNAAFGKIHGGSYADTSTVHT